MVLQLGNAWSEGEGERERTSERKEVREDHLRGDNRNFQGLILQDAGTVGVKPNEVPQGEELPAADVVISAVGVDLEVMHVVRLAQVRDGVVTWLSNTLTHKVGSKLPHHI